MTDSAATIPATCTLITDVADVQGGDFVTYRIKAEGWDNYTRSAWVDLRGGRLVDSWGWDAWRAGFVSAVRPQFARGAKVTRGGAVYTVAAAFPSGQLNLRLPVKARAGTYGKGYREVHVLAAEAARFRLAEVS